MNVVSFISNCCLASGGVLLFLAGKRYQSNIPPGTPPFRFGKRRQAAALPGTPGTKPTNTRLLYALALMLVGFSLNVGAAAARPSAKDLCDDVLFSAAHPGLDASDAAPPEAFVRRFLHLAREVSPSNDCNLRSWSEAYGRASKAVVNRFAADGRRDITQLLKRRETENVTLDVLGVEARGADTWFLHWVEHVKSPRGDQLRSETYSGLVRVGGAKPSDFKVTEFSSHLDSVASEHAQPEADSTSR